jgi:hypothetical protein
MSQYEEVSEMTSKNTAVLGIYPNQTNLQEGVDTLRAAGFRNTDISVLAQENLGTKDFAHEKSTKAPEGAAAGACIGAVTGGVLGWLVAIGTLAIPGLGSLVNAGPIVAALAGMGAVGAVGAIAGAFVGRRIPEYEAKRYTGRVKSGGALLSVHCDNLQWAKRAKQILRNTGAEAVSSRGEAHADYAKSDKPLPRVPIGSER